jgi:hypothetical protein
MRLAFYAGSLELSGSSVVLKRHRRMLEKVMKRQMGQGRNGLVSDGLEPNSEAA